MITARGFQSVSKIIAFPSKQGYLQTFNSVLTHINQKKKQKQPF